MRNVTSAWSLNLSIMRFVSLAAVLVIGGCKQRSVRTGVVPLEVRLIVTCGTANAGPPIESGASGGSICLDQTSPSVIHGSDVDDARLEKGLDGLPLVKLTLSKAAMRRIHDFTEKNVGNHMAIIVNGKLLSVPLVVGPGTDIPIQGHLTQAEAKRIVSDFKRAAGNQ